MANVHIGELTSTIRATDSEALLSPVVLERIVREVLARVREEQRHAARVREERQVRPGVSWASQSPESATWGES